MTAERRVVRVDEVQPRDVVQLAMMGSTFTGLAALLQDFGLTVDPLPVEGDDIPTFIVGIGDD